MKEAEREFSSIKEGCFDTVKKIWNPDASLNDNNKSAKNVKDSMENLNYIVEQFQYNQVEDALDNPKKMRELLIDAGKNSQLADNPKFIATIRKKMGSLIKQQ